MTERVLFLGGVETVSQIAKSHDNNAILINLSNFNQIEHILATCQTAYTSIPDLQFEWRIKIIAPYFDRIIYERGYEKIQKIIGAKLPSSYPIHLSNVISEWSLTDSKERFEYNIRNNINLLSENGWDAKSKIFYRYNSFGFRCKEFEEEIRPKMLFLGCSHTVGIGLSEEDTWPHIVSSNFNCVNYNLGIGGASNDRIFRVALEFIEKIKPEYVICLFTYKERVEFFNMEGNHFNLLPNNLDFIDDKLIKRFYSEVYLQSEHNLSLNLVKNKFSLSHLLERKNIKFYHFDIDVDFMDCSCDYARDLLHAGKNTNKKFAQKVIEVIEKDFAK